VTQGARDRAGGGAVASGRALRRDGRR
jgi:hypothetical protein